jgi:flagellar hook protein FlgE
MALIGSLSSGVSGLQTFSKDLEIIGNNIANVNTTAFKSGSLSFEESFSNTLRASQPSTGNTSNVLAAQIGTGVQFSGVNTNFNQGALTSTGQDTDLGISGEGYFIVQSPTDGSLYATRVGSFRWDDNGYLVTQSGMQVLDTAGAAIQLGPVPAPTSPATSNALQSVSVNPSGQVIEYYTDGTNNSAGTPQTIGMATFKQKGGLMSEGNGLYDFSVAGMNTPASGTYGTPGTAGYGTVEAGTLEQSNVDLTSEFANMITAQRSFQANARVVTVSDSLLDDIVNLKRS